MRFALLLCCSVASLVHAQDAPRARLKDAFGGEAVDAVGRFDYRLMVRDETGASLRDAQYALAPAASRLYLRELSGASAEVWSEREGTWRLSEGQLTFLGPQATRPYREHVAYHFLPLLADRDAQFETLTSDRIRITPAGADAFEVVLDPRTGLIRENRFDGGVIGRELDYRAVAGVHWPMTFEIVADGRITRRGRFTQVSVQRDSALPDVTVPTAAPALPATVSDGAQLVGAGWLSSARNEYNLSQDGKGSVLVFARSGPDFVAARIMISWRDGAGWTAPIEAPFTDPRYSDSDPWLTPDGAHLYFISNRPTRKDAAPRNNLDLWRVALRGRAFGEPEHLAALNSEGQELGPEVHDGWIYFNSSRPGGPAKLSIYRARLQANGFAPPEPLGAPFNDGRAQGDFTLSPDGQIALFWSERDGVADADVFAARRDARGWSKAVRLPSPINAVGFDFTPSFSPDGRELRFASMRKPGWLSDAQHILNGQSNVFTAPASIVYEALSAR